jgi:hypothetical protein
MKRIAMLLFGLALSVPAFAQQPISSAGWLNTNCKAAQNPPITDATAMDAGMCDGFMIGWRDGVIGLLVMDKGKPVQILMADGVTIGQMERVFITYMAAHPELENKTADFVLSQSLSNAGLVGTKPLPVPITTN